MENNQEITIEDVENNAGMGKMVLLGLFFSFVVTIIATFLVDMSVAMQVLLCSLIVMNVATFLYMCFVIAGIYSLIKRNTGYIGELLNHVQILYASTNSIGNYVQALGTKQHDLERAMGEECIYAKPQGMFNIDNSGGNEGGTPLQ